MSGMAKYNIVYASKSMKPFTIPWDCCCILCLVTRCEGTYLRLVFWRAFQEAIHGCGEEPV